MIMERDTQIVKEFVGRCAKLMFCTSRFSNSKKKDKESKMKKKTGKREINANVA